MPVLSKAILETDAKRSRASPSRTRKLWRVAFPIAAMIAVGVAKTRAQGQKTTKMVTARIISPVMIQVRSAAVRAITTIHVAQRSAIPTILAFRHLLTVPTGSYAESNCLHQRELLSCQKRRIDLPCRLKPHRPLFYPPEGILQP